MGKHTEEHEERSKIRTYDDVFDHVQSFGRYQRWLYFGMKILGIGIGMQFSALVFGMGTPKFQCTTGNVKCPPRKCCDNCTNYEFVGGFTTTVSEWNLICDRGYIGASLQSSYFVGMLIGSLIIGPISDACGRKVCIFTCYGIMCGYVYTMELVGPKRRTEASTLTGIFIVFTGLVSVALAYLIREWRILLLIYTLPSGLPLLFIKLFPESPRWLIRKGRIDEAESILVRCGGKKGKTLDSYVLRNLLQEICEDQKISEENEKKYTHVDMVRTRKLRKYSAIMAYEWFTVAFSSFGIFLYLSQLSGNIYANYAIYEAIGILTVPLDLLLLPRFGRRLVFATYCFIGGTALLIIQVIYKDYALLATALCLFVSIVGPSWNGVYLVTAELFPTVLRNTGVGSGSLCARIGGIAAPYFAMTAQLPGLNLTFPVTVFGVTILIAGALYFFIPETLFAKMHQTVEQAEAAKDEYGIVCCGKRLRGQAGAGVVTMDATSDVVVCNVATKDANNSV